MTLKELIEKHGFGVWLAINCVKVFKPLAYSESVDIVIGEDADGYADFCSSEDCSFILYQAPIKTKTVTMWQPILKGDSGNSAAHRLFDTKEDAIGYNIAVYKVIGAAPIGVEVLENEV